MPLLANTVTDQGLGEESVANGAGNPVLYDGRPWGGGRGLPQWQSLRTLRITLALSRWNRNTDVNKRQGDESKYKGAKS